MTRDFHSPTALLPLSRQIKELETQLQTPLFERTARQPRLTAAGEAFYPRARNLLSELLKASEMTTQIGNGQLGTLRLSHSSTVPMSGPLLQGISNWLERCPGVSMDIAKLSSEAQLEEIADGRLDVGLLRLPVLRQRDGVRVVPLYSEQLLLAVPPNHPLANSSTPIELEQLKDEAFISIPHPQRGGLSYLSAELCMRAGFFPKAARVMTFPPPACVFYPWRTRTASAPWRWPASKRQARWWSNSAKPCTNAYKLPPMIKDPFARLGLDREVLTVSQLNGRARVLLEDVFTNIWVEGEISNLARPASGHVYFTLKDSGAQVRCALFRNNAARVRQALKDGLAVKVRGKVSLFEGRGDYQLILDTVEPAGDGALRLAFDALKEKLSAEGLFSAERKVPLPAHPRRIGIISSPTGAVIRDIISVFRRRAPNVELTLIPTAVQGREAIPQIVRALKLADARGFDALILARGGGSLEDLWCFNEEAVARAVDACVTPIVSAVGHETDVSICDFVADVRAPTPSAAAELLAPDASHLVRQVENLHRRLVMLMRNRLTHDRLRLEGMARRLRHPGERLRQQAQRLDDLDMRLRRAFERSLNTRRERLIRLETRLAGQHPGRQLALLRQRLDSLAERLPRAMREGLKARRLQLQSQVQTLQVVSPLATLGRGYSILLDERGQAIRNAAQTHTGQRLTARLGEGQLQVRVEDNHLTPVTLSLLD
ncbi:hypothetical protein BHE74_00006009 [Ensete ventricosum]|nr:hypothetical protein BHE74_00006009 [Ensete ventricosum]